MNGGPRVLFWLVLVAVVAYLLYRMGEL